MLADGSDCPAAHRGFVQSTADAVCLGVFFCHERRRRLDETKKTPPRLSTSVMRSARLMLHVKILSAAFRFSTFES